MKSFLTCLTQNLLLIRRLSAVTTATALGWLALASVAHAQTDYVSVASGALSDSTIWNPSGVPGPNDTLEIAAGTAVTNTVSQATVGPVTIAAGGTFVLNASMTVATITNNGTLNLNANSSGRILTLNGNFANNGSVTTSSSSGLDQIQFGNTNAPSLWLGSGDLSGAKVQFLVNAGATLDISGLTSPVKFRPTGTMVSTIAGTQVINNGANTKCSFVLAAGGTLITANPNGIVNGTGGTLNFANPATFDPVANYVFNGTTAQTTTGLPAAANNLTIANAAGVTLSAAVVLTGTLALDSGVLLTTSGTTPTAAAVTSTAGAYVNGPLALVYSGPGAQTFPVGKGGNERAVTLNYTALTGSSTVTVEQFEIAMGGTVPPGTTQFNSRYWTVGQTGGSGLAYELTVDGTGFSPAATPVLLQQGVPDISYNATVSLPDYTAAGLTTFGSFTLGDFVPSANHLAFTTSAQTLTAGVTSGTMTVQLQDSGNAPLNAAGDLTVLLTTTSGSGVFRDTGDTTTITSVIIPSGNNSASFKYHDTKAPATPALTVSAAGANPAMQKETINPAGASQLAFTTQPASTNINATMAPVVMQLQDQYGNAVAQNGVAITLTLNNGGAAVLNGTISQNTDASGAATFGDLAVTTAPGRGLTLTATGGLMTVVSSSFDITPQIIVKALNNTALNQDTSWTGGVQPGVNDLAQINDTSVSTSVNSSDIGAGVSWYGLSITGWSASHGYTVTDFNGYDFITLGAGGLTGVNVTHTISLNCGLALATDEVWDWSGSGGILTFNNQIDNGGHQLVLGGNQSITVSSVGGGMTGAGSLIKQGSGTLTLGGYQDYTGATVVSNGTLLVSGTLAGSSAVIVAGGTFTGNGSCYSSPVTVQSGGTFAPGGGLTALYLGSNLTLQTGSQTKVTVNRDTLGSDQVNGIIQANYGGTLVVNNAAGTPAQEGDAFTLFSAASFTGNFSGISGSPGAGLAWSFDPTNGVLSVVAGGTAMNPTNLTATVAGNALTLTWPDDHLGWFLQAQTNSLAAGLGTNWVDVPGSDASTTNVITINPANPTAFFRLRSP